MRSINPDQILIRAEELRLQVTSFNQVIVEYNDKRVSCSAHIFRILDAFAHPTSYREALAALQGRIAGVQDWIQLTADMNQLVEVGVLHSEDKHTVALPSKGNHFNTVPAHAMMLNDRARTAGFIQAIREVVQPGDIVVDIGTGSGVLATAAALAGAGHVYAIDRGMIGEIAKQVFAANGVADRITFLRGASTELELPERADVLVSEIIGQEPLGESILATTQDAFKRLLKPGARCIPANISIHALPIMFAPEQYPLNLISNQTLDHWRSWYAIDFSPLKIAQQEPVGIPLMPQHLRNYTALSAPVCLCEVDLAHIEELTINVAVETTALRAGRVDGIFIFFESQLSPSVQLSTSPYRADKTNHWSHLAWMLKTPFEVEAGTRFQVQYQHSPGTAGIETSASATRL